MNTLTKLLTTTLFTLITANSINANTTINETIDYRYEGLTYDYFYGTNSNVSVNVKRVIASDSKTSPAVLKILTNDTDVAVWLLSKENLETKSF